MNLHERLKTERERLGFNQTAFAAMAGASKHSQINWEKGLASPNAAALAAWAAAGLDVLFVVTGQRLGIPEPAAQPLARDEEILLDNYRNSPADAKTAIKAASDAFARSARGGKRDKAA